MSENIPGTNIELVKRLFARGESADSAGFIEFFTSSFGAKVASSK